MAFTENPSLKNLIDTLSHAEAADDRALLLLSDSGDTLFANPAGDALLRHWSHGGELPPALRAAMRDAPLYLRRPLPDAAGAELICLPLDDRSGQRVYLFRADRPTPEAEAYRLIRRFAVHDLRSPLQALLATTEGQAPALSAAARTALDRITDILALSRAETLAELSCAFDPATTIAAIVTMLQPLAQSRQVPLVFDPPPRRAEVQGPEPIFRLLAQNLIGNAVRHGAGLRRIRLRMELDRPGLWTITLEQWQQAGTIPRALLEGLARGTAETSEGVRLMHAAGQILHGSWDLLSRPGEEAIALSFALPEAAELAPTEATPAAPPHDLAGARILIIEDNTVVRDWLAQAFRRAGALVSTAADGMAGLLLAETAAPAFDAVLLDLVLPGLDGLSIARRLRLRERRGRPRLIGFSAQDDAETRAACAEAGIRLLLPKPLPAAQLLTRVAHEIHDLRSSEPPMDQSPAVPSSPAQRLALFNDAIVQELLTDLGAEGARRFMGRALDEAAETLQALQDQGFGATTRAQLHSSVGSCGITGLRLVEACLRRIQDTGRESGALTPRYRELAEAIEKTRTALKDGGPPGRSPTGR